MDFENVMIALNILFAILFWKFAVDAFEEDKETLGWFNIFISAFNTAVVVNVLIN